MGPVAALLTVRWRAQEAAWQIGAIPAAQLGAESRQGIDRTRLQRWHRVSSSIHGMLGAVRILCMRACAYRAGDVIKRTNKAAEDADDALDTEANSTSLFRCRNESLLRPLIRHASPAYTTHEAHGKCMRACMFPQPAPLHKAKAKTVQIMAVLGLVRWLLIALVAALSTLGFFAVACGGGRWPRCGRHVVVVGRGDAHRRRVGMRELSVIAVGSPIPPSLVEE